MKSNAGLHCFVLSHTSVSPARKASALIPKDLFHDGVINDAAAQHATPRSLNPSQRNTHTLKLDLHMTCHKEENRVVINDFISMTSLDIKKDHIQCSATE